MPFARFSRFSLAGMFSQKSMKAPSSEPKGDSKMKRFFVFTLILLFATTCLHLTNLRAESDSKDGYRNAGNLWGSACVSTSFDAPYAKSSHGVYVANYGPGAVKLYGTFTIKVYWSGGGSFTPTPTKKEKEVPLNGSASAYQDFSVNLRRKPKGNARITASTHLRVRDDVTDTDSSWPTASCTTHFDL